MEGDNLFIDKVVCVLVTCKGRHEGSREVLSAPAEYAGVNKTGQYVTLVLSFGISPTLHLSSTVYPCPVLALYRSASWLWDLAKTSPRLFNRAASLSCDSPRVTMAVCGAGGGACSSAEIAASCHHPTLRTIALVCKLAQRA